MSIEAKLEERGLYLPEPMQMPGGVELPFVFVNIVGNRAIISGHLPQAPDGTIAEPLGKVGADVSPEQAHEAARIVGQSILASLSRALGELDRVEQWVRLFGMVNAAPGFNRLPPVINGCSNLILELYGERGRHARSAVGMGTLPFEVPVEIEGEVIIKT